MALNTTPKATSAVSAKPSATIQRREVSITKQTASSARAEALKARLTGAPPPQPPARRPAGSTARREEMAKLQKFNTPAPQSPPGTSRPVPQNLESIEPPPSGLVQPGNNIEAPAKAPEVTRAPSDPQTDAFARRERQIRRAQQDLKAAQDAWKREQANYISRDRLKSETLQVLAEDGITPDKLVELQLNQAPKDPNQILLDRISQLESQLNGFLDPEKGALAQRDQQDYNAAVGVIRNDVSLLVDSNPDFGTIKSEGQTEEVVNLITRCFDEEGVILDVEEAAKLVEDKLVDRLTKQYERLTKLDKLKKKFGTQAEPAEASTPQPSAPKTVSNTLTNAGAAMQQLSPRYRAILRVQEAMEAAKRK